MTLVKVIAVQIVGLLAADQAPQHGAAMRWC
jgi:hypothetical protein